MNYRTLTMQDADFMLELKNYPETRQFAIQSHEEIKREDHIKWLKKNKQFFHVIETRKDGLMFKYGIIRVQDKEISIWISRVFWGKGIATGVLMELSLDNHWCKIVNGNVGSFKAFVRAGFVPVDYKDNYYILRK